MVRRIDTTIHRRGIAHLQRAMELMQFGVPKRPHDDTEAIEKWITKRAARSDREIEPYIEGGTRTKCSDLEETACKDEANRCRWEVLTKPPVCKPATTNKIASWRTKAIDEQQPTPTEYARDIQIPSPEIQTAGIDASADLKLKLKDIPPHDTDRIEKIVKGHKMNLNKHMRKLTEKQKQCDNAVASYERRKAKYERNPTPENKAILDNRELRLFRDCQ